MPGPVVPDSRHFSILNKMQRIQEGKAIEMQKRKKRILVFSVDAFVCEDLEKLLQLPNGKKYLAKGCRVTEGMRTIYPSVTYPAHVSMLTGCYAGTHGVTSNFAFTTADKEQNWRWCGGYKVDDIFHAAKRAGIYNGFRILAGYCQPSGCGLADGRILDAEGRRYSAQQFCGCRIQPGNA